uniref:Uncharacterized protein n=1 Tax=Mucochytrium quahogii TaxID=96639 RepID=A0A7S2SMI1_9STRA|mmetsp:Transcript_7926/g.14527  ORF Transcript_7926/g.14527 Transcript_7926/m.14527 type:complete len:1859 (+) Transcript_7926:155-5731(+)
MSGVGLVDVKVLEAEKVKFERRSQKVLAILSKKDARIAELERKVDESSLLKKLQEGKGREQLLRAKVKDQSDQIEVLIAEVATLRQGQHASNEKQKSAKQIAEEQREQIKHLEFKLEDSNAALDKLRVENEVKDGELNNQKSALDAARATCEGLEQKVQGLESLLETAKKTTLGVESQLASAREKITRLTTRTTGEHPSEQKARQLMLQVRQLNTQLEESERVVNNMRRGYKQQQQKLTSSLVQSKTTSDVQLEQIVTKQSEELVELRARLIRQGADQRKIEQDREFERRTLVNNIRNLEERVRRVTENGKVHRKQLESSIRVLSGKSDLHKELAKAEESISTLTGTISKLELSMATNNTKIEELNSKLQDANREREKAETELQTFRVASVYADVPNVSHTAILQKTAKELEEYKMRSQKDSESPPKIHSQYMPVEDSEIDILPMSEAEERRLCSRLRFRIRGLELQLHHKVKESEIFRERIEKLSTEARQRSEQFGQQTLELEKKHSEQLSVMNRRVISHVREKQVFMEENERLLRSGEVSKSLQFEWETRYADVRDKFAEAKKRFLKDTEKLKTENDSMGVKLRIVEACREEDKSRLEYLEEALDTLQGGVSVSDADQVAVTLSSQLHSAEAEKGELRQRNLKLDALCGELKNEHEKLQRIVKKQSEEIKGNAYLLQQEADATKELRKQIQQHEKENDELRQSIQNLELKLIDVQVTRDATQCDRDALVEEINELKTVHEKELAKERAASLESIRAYEHQSAERGKSLVNSHLDTLRTTLNEIVSMNADNGIHAFQRLAQTVLESERARLELELEMDILTWESQRREVQRASTNMPSTCWKHAKEIEQLKRRHELETSLKAMHAERQLQLQRTHLAAMESCFIRANSRYKAKCKQLQCQTGEEDDTEENIVDSLSQIHSLTERNISLQTQLSDVTLRLEQTKLMFHSEDESRRHFVENEKKQMENIKHELVRTRNQLHATKKELVELSFEYETKLMLLQGEESSVGVLRELENAATLQRKILVQSKEISSMHEQITTLQSELAEAGERERELETRLVEETQKGELVVDKAPAVQVEKQEVRSRIEALSQQTMAVMLEQKDSQITRLRAEADILSKRLRQATGVNKDLSSANANIVLTLQKFEKYFEKRKRGPSAEDEKNLGSRLENFLSMLEGGELEHEVNLIRGILDKYSEGNTVVEQLRQELEDKVACLKELEKQLNDKSALSDEEARTMGAGLKLAQANVQSMAVRTEKLEFEAKELNLKLSQSEDRLQAELKRKQAIIEELDEMKHLLNEGSERNTALEEQLSDLCTELEQAREEIHTLEEQAEERESIRLGVWQNPENDFETRRGMVSQIVRILQNIEVTHFIDSLPKVSTMIEEILYTEASSNSEYVDRSTLKRRVKSANRKIGNDFSSGPSAKPMREVLSETVSNKLANEELVKLEDDLAQQRLALSQCKQREKQQLAKVKQLEKKLLTQSGSLARAKRQITELRENWSTPETVNRLKSELANAKIEIRKAKFQISRKQDMLTAALEKTKTEQVSEEGTERRLAKFEKRAKAAEHELASKDALFQATRATLNEYKDQMKVLRAEAESTALRIDAHQREKSMLRNKTMVLQQQIQHLKAQSAISQPSTDKENSANKQTNIDRDKEKLEYDKLRKRILFLQNKNEAEKSKFERLNSELAELNDKLTSSIEAQKPLKKKIKSLEKSNQQLVGQVDDMNKLAQLHQNGTLLAEKALCTALCKVADEAFQVRKQLFDRELEQKKKTGPEIEASTCALANMLQLSTEDVKDIFGAEARQNDPAIATSLENLRNAISRHKTFVHHLFNARSGHPTGLSEQEVDNLVRSTCRLWRVN